MTSKLTSSGPSRRTVVKGAAWAVPAIVVASATPAFASSPIVTVTSGGLACKLSGNSCGPKYSKGYLQPLTICNSSLVSITVTITTPAFLDFNDTSMEFTPNPASFTIAAGKCQDVVLNINLQDNSEQSHIKGTLYWTYTATDGRSGSSTTPIDSLTTPPCVNCTV